MHIRKGDNVIVISGADKGKKGKVAAVYPSKGLLLVEGVNIRKHHQKRRSENQKGQMVDKTMPMRSSKVMLVDGSGKATRVGHREIGGKKVRVAVKSGKEI